MHRGNVSIPLVLHLAVFSMWLHSLAAEQSLAGLGSEFAFCCPSPQDTPLPLLLYPCGKLGQSLWGKQIQMFEFTIWIYSSEHWEGAWSCVSPISLLFQLVPVLSSRRILCFSTMVQQLIFYRCVPSFPLLSFQFPVANCINSHFHQDCSSVINL